MRVFYLGTHRPHWLSDSTVPLFVSDTTLRRYRNLPRADARWALDSGAFGQLQRRGGWQDGPTARQYAARVRRYSEEVGGLDWASPQDHMVEPWMLARTGLSLRRHLELIVANYIELRGIDDSLPIIPVVQGWLPGDYADCVELYERCGSTCAANAWSVWARYAVARQPAKQPWSSRGCVHSDCFACTPSG